MVSLKPSQRKNAYLGIAVKNQTISYHFTSDFLSLSFSQVSTLENFPLLESQTCWSASPISTSCNLLWISTMSFDLAWGQNQSPLLIIVESLGPMEEPASYITLCPYVSSKQPTVMPKEYAITIFNLKFKKLLSNIQKTQELFAAPMAVLGNRHFPKITPFQL